MDDCVLISHSKEVLNNALAEMRKLLADLKLEFNDKTQIFPIAHGIEYLGWRFYLTETGVVIRRLKKHSKIRWQHRMRKLQKEYTAGKIELSKINESIVSYQNHICYGNTHRLYHTMQKN